MYIVSPQGNDLLHFSPFFFKDHWHHIDQWMISKLLILMLPLSLVPKDWVFSGGGYAEILRGSVGKKKETDTYQMLVETTTKERLGVRWQRGEMVMKRSIIFIFILFDFLLITRIYGFISCITKKKLTELTETHRKHYMVDTLY